MRIEENTKKRKWVDEDGNSPQGKRSAMQRGKNLELVFQRPISCDPDPTPEEEEVEVAIEEEEEEGEEERAEREARRRFNLRIRRLPTYIVAPRPNIPGPPRRQYVPDEGVPGFWTIQAERRRAMRTIQGTCCPVCGEEYSTLPRKTFRSSLRETPLTYAVHQSGTYEQDNRERETPSNCAVHQSRTFEQDNW